MDPDQIKLWWTKWPNAMIGAAVPESLLVIDIDPRNGGSLQALTDLVGALPETLTAWSGRNDCGHHLYFLRPPGPLTSTRLPEGIDLKINGYCIVPPSIHPATGLPYRWTTIPLRRCRMGCGSCCGPQRNPSRPTEAVAAKRLQGWCAPSRVPPRANGTASCSGLPAEPPRKASLIKSKTS
jgi:hypothetical protein